MCSKFVLFGIVAQCAFYSLILAEDGKAQSKSIEEVKVNVKLSDASFEEFIAQVERQTEFTFFYEDVEVRELRNFNLKASNRSLRQVLETVSRKTGLSFRQVNNSIAVFMKDPLHKPVVEAEAPVQRMLVSGRVSGTDSPGGLPGVNVIIKGTQNGTVTDVNGNYSLEVPGPESILIFSSIGYVSEEIVVGNRSIIDVELVQDITSLEEIVVIGYGSQEKESITGSVETIGAENLSRTTSTTVSGALVGKAAGVTYRQKSGQPGSSTSLQIRNLGTPLYVIDGVIRDEGQFNNLDVNDIENISILKDGAAAIYGVKAANGVVLVTTKSGGLNEKPTVTFNMYRGWQEWTSYPQLLTPYEWNYANYMKDVNNGSLAVSPEVARAELEKWRNGYYNPETGEDYRGFDWYDEYVHEGAPQMYFQSTVSGGGDKSTYYFSLSHIDQDAVFRDYNFNRTNLQANFDTRVTERLKVGVKINGRIENRINPGLPGGDDYAAARTALFELPPIYRPYANDNALYLNAIPGRNGQNLAAMTREHAGTFDEKWRVVQSNWDLEYETGLEGLTANALFSYSLANQATDNFEKGWKEYTYDPATETYSVAYDKSAAGETYLNKIRAFNQDLSGQLRLNYDNVFGAHHITAMLGTESYKHVWNFMQVQQNPVENEFVSLLATSENNTVTENTLTTSTSSFIFRAGYEFDDKYILQVAGRYDGSWRFPKEERWGFFPSVSGAWRLSEESFFKDMVGATRWLGDIKLRASYGEMGDDNLGAIYPDFAYLPGYSYYQGSALISPDPFGSAGTRAIVGARSKGIPITGLSWITSSIANIGLDVGFFGNKLLLEYDVFKRVREGIPAIPTDVQFPIESGLSVLPRNLNSDATLGMDMALNWREIRGDLSYFVGVNATLARQKYLETYGQTFMNAWDRYRYSMQDRWSNVAAGEVWMYETIGVFRTQEEIDNYPVIIDGNNNTNLVPGDLIFKDVNNDGVINQYDERPLGYASADWPWDSSKGNKNPLMTLGVNVGFEWKGLDFAADFAGGFMNTFVADWQVKWGVNRGTNGYAYNSLDVWHHEDILDPTSPWVPGDFPAIRDGNASTRWWNDFYTKEASYLRLRNVVLGYTLPEQWTSRLKIEKFRIYFQGSNLFYVFNSLRDYGFDPEISTVNGQDYPQHKVYTTGINITF